MMRLVGWKAAAVVSRKSVQAWPVGQTCRRTARMSSFLRAHTLCCPRGIKHGYQPRVGGGETFIPNCRGVSCGAAGGCSSVRRRAGDRRHVSLCDQWQLHACKPCASDGCIENAGRAARHGRVRRKRVPLYRAEMTGGSSCRSKQSVRFLYCHGVQRECCRARPEGYLPRGNPPEFAGSNPAKLWCTPVRGMKCFRLGSCHGKHGMRVMVGSWFTDVPFHVRSYAVEVDFKPLAITPEVVVNDTKRIEARKAIKKMFQERYTQGKNKWFFSKLRF